MMYTTFSTEIILCYFFFLKKETAASECEANKTHHMFKSALKPWCVLSICFFLNSEFLSLQWTHLDRQQLTSQYKVCQDISSSRILYVGNSEHLNSRIWYYILFNSHTWQPNKFRTRDHQETTWCPISSSITATLHVVSQLHSKLQHSQAINLHDCLHNGNSCKTKFNRSVNMVVWHSA
jgi:hypothetical protein